MPRPPNQLVLALLTLAAFATGCGDEPTPANHAAVDDRAATAPLDRDDGWYPVAASGRLGRPDVVVIVLDAARADAFGAYGDPRPTPAVDGLAAAGTLFESALAPAPWTGATVPALLTGLHPEVLGIEHWESRLPAAARTLAERMAAAGYHTALFSQHPIYGSHRALTRGFETFVERLEKPHDELPAMADLLRPETPTFAYIHLLPPHTPYDPPPPFRGSLVAGPLPAPLPPSGEVDAPFLSEFPHRRDPAELPAEALRAIHDRYREHVAFADSLVGRLLDDLRAAGRFDDALVIVTSDHGEAFLEHGYFMHTRYTYREFLRVPLVVKWPAGLGGFAPRVEETVGLVDLVPTLVDGLDLAAAPDERFSGFSLLPGVLGGELPVRGVLASTRGLARPHRPARWHAALEHGGWTLVRDLETGIDELYRLADDPTQQHDLAAAEPERLAELARRLERRRRLDAERHATLGEGGAESLDAETERRLRALGYL